MKAQIWRKITTFSLLLILEGVNIAAESGFVFFLILRRTLSSIRDLMEKKQKSVPHHPYPSHHNKICAEKRSCSCESKYSMSIDDNGENKTYQNQCRNSPYRADAVATPPRRSRSVKTEKISMLKSGSQRALAL